MASSGGAEAWTYRSLRRADVPSYVETILSGVGRLEVVTGLNEGLEESVRTLGRSSVRVLLRLFRLVGRPVMDVYVATDGRRVVGTGTVFWRPNAGYVAGMATRPECRGHGIASHLLEILRARAQERGKPWLALDVESENEGAIRIYRRAGYLEQGRFVWYRREGLPTVGPPTSPSARTAAKGELRSLVSRVNAARPTELAAALPARPRMVDHNELLVRGGWVDFRTWVTGPSSEPSAGLRAYSLSRRRMAVYYPFTVPGGRAEGLAGLFDAATEWLEPNAPGHALAVAPDPAGPLAAELERCGFKPVISTTVMVRPSGERT